MIIYDDDGIGHDVVPRKAVEKIREEIKALAEEYDFYADTRRKYGLHTAVEIIDKHLKEIEK